MYRDRIEEQNERYQMIGSSLAVVGLAGLWVGLDQQSVTIALVAVVAIVMADLAFTLHKKNRQRYKRFSDEVRGQTRSGLLINQENVILTYYELQKMLSSVQFDLLLAEQNGCYVAIEREQELDKLYDRIHQFTDDAQWLGFEIPKPAKVIPFKRQQIA